MKHQMRARRWRHAKARRMRQFWSDMMRLGGNLICAPDVFERLDVGLLLTLQAANVNVYPSRWVAPRQAFGMLPPPPLPVGPEHLFDYAESIPDRSSVFRLTYATASSPAYYGLSVA